MGDLRTAMSSKRCLVLLAIGAVVAVSANSLGLGVPTCSTDDPSIWGSNYMYWCTAPTWDTDFSVRSADGASSADPTTYRPDGLVYIHVRALKLGHKFRGLLLYAQDDDGRKVGSWELPVEKEIMFHTPPGSCEDESGVRRGIMHSGADPKNYHNMFAFRAPSKKDYSGRITFKCLLKTGEANTGAFHWPNKAALTLTQDSRKSPLNNWLVAKGKSCTDTCKAFNKLCDEPKLQKITSEAKFMASIGKEHVCKLPIVKSCETTTPFQWCAGTKCRNDFCQYHGTDCREAKAVSCDAKGGIRYCACKGSTKLSEDAWGEQDAWAELAELEAVTSSDVTPATTPGCGQYYNSKDKCQAAGCKFSEQEGMVECTRTL